MISLISYLSLSASSTAMVIPLIMVRYKTKQAQTGKCSGWLGQAHSQATRTAKKGRDERISWSTKAPPI
jgi:hypothetical protein